MVPFVTGQRVGDFEVGAAAGFGFHATQLSTGRSARLTILTEEAPAYACGVSHPNIATLLNSGAEDAVYYAASEWVDGETLRQKMRKERLPVQRAIGYAAQIASGLAALHHAGVVHADLKPENIAITKDGRVKILDCGLASVTVVRTGDALVADYAAPEQVRGEAETPASDIFSLGVILYEMLSGTRPFLRSSLPATTKAILQSEPPHELPPGVTPALARIVRHCITKAPEDRFASASDLAFTLESFWNLTIPHDKTRKLQKRGLTGLFLACAIGGILGVGIGAVVARRYLRPVSTTPLTFRHLTASGHDAMPSASQSGRTMVYSSDRDGISRIWTMPLENGQETPVTSGPDRFPRLSPDGKTVLFVHENGLQDSLYTAPLSVGTPTKLIEGVHSADWCPDGSIVWLRVTGAGATVVSTLGIADASGRQVAEIARVKQQVLSFPRCSPDGTLVAAVSGPSEAIHTSVVVAHTSGGEQHSLSPPSKDGAISALTWAPKSENLIYFQNDNPATGDEWAAGGAHIVRQNARTGGALILGFSQQNAQSVEMLGPNRLLIDSGSRRENLEEIGLHEQRSLTLGDTADSGPSYARGDASIFYSSFRGGTTGVWELLRKDGASHPVIVSVANDTEPSPFSDGKRILWTSDREGHPEIYWAVAENPHPRAVTHDGVDAGSATITADDGWVVYNSANPAHAGVWKIRQTGIDGARLAEGPTRWPAVSPDGRHVLYTVDRGPLQRAIQVVTLEDGTRVGPPILLDMRRGAASSSVGRAHWMPNGRAIAYIGQDEHGRTGVYVQDWPSGTKRTLGGFYVSRGTESFTISGDGATLTLSTLDRSTGIVEVSNLSER